jgi:hypothetical protein
MAQTRRDQFTKALAAGRNELTARLKERERIYKRLAKLEQEIPTWERTVAALEAQLQPKETHAAAAESDTPPLQALDLPSRAAEPSRSVGLSPGDPAARLGGHRSSRAKRNGIPDSVIQQLPADYRRESEDSAEIELPPIDGRELLK